MDPVKVTTNTYNLIASDYNDKYYDYYKGNLKHIDRFLGSLPKRSNILDAGCAGGGISFYLHEKGYEVTAIDISEKMIEIAKKQVPDVDFKVMDIRSLDFSANSFDGIIADYSLIHIPKKDIVKTLKGFNTVLKPQGKLFISIFEGTEEKYIDDPFKPGENVFWDFYTSEEFKRYLKEADFSILYEEKQKTEADGEDFLSDELIYIAQK